VQLLKHAHVTLALVSLGGFTVRGYWMLMDSPLLERRWVKVAPHIVDTILLLSGLALVVHYHFFPTDHPWLAAKLVALLVYIVLGSIALKRGKTRGVRAAAFAGALAAFAYILVAALTHRALPLS